jgi:hypothetical protein
MTRLTRALSLVSLNSSVTWACSGPGASGAIARASRVGLVCLLISFSATIASMVRGRALKRKVLPIAAVVLLLIHPTMWLGVSSGDCGAALMYAGPVMAALHLGVLGLLAVGKPPR